jgi:hypothetical protein
LSDQAFACERGVGRRQPGTPNRFLAGGTFDLMHADPVEANEAHIQGLPRLRFRFDRRSLGRLRQLVDLLNREIE